ncbi:hypothetical protein ANO11243_060840 [Dothideomycetidae sp. 11243]|nr:hypothetical protein ANO11243_060840 [fungal sp. No.11243]
MAAHSEASSEQRQIYTLIDYEDTYVQPLLQKAVQRLASSTTTLVPISDISALPSPDFKCLVWAQYESLPFQHAASHSRTTLLNAYVFRKALIRKHYLATVVRNWLVKHPSSILGKHVAPAVDFEVDYAEFLDDALVECYELNEAIERNEALERSERSWWIVKAGMGERGQGIKLFSTLEELQEVFEAWDPDSDDEGEGSDVEETPRPKDEDDGIVTSQMRHFVAQPYIHPPLLLKEPFESAGRKFHIRTYVLAVGALKVYVYRRMLALFAGATYESPSEAGDPNESLGGHLTNTCRQTGEREGSVHEFWSLEESAADLEPGWKERVFQQISEATGEVFEAAARGMMMHFQPLPNSFEVYGLDFIVDATGNTWLLEVNAFPDFAQTGKDLSVLIADLFDGVVSVAIRPFFDLSEEQGDPAGSDLLKVLDIDLGKR